jgi:DNA-binding response OmpR family regulator
MNDHLSSCILNEEYSKPGGSLVLLIEDDRELAEEIRLDLEAGGHMVQVAETSTEGLRAARSGDAAVLVVDRVLDGENGLSIIEVLRGEGKWTPALVVSEITSVDERIAGLKAGCDDYLVKPFDVRELTARVEALLRRRGEMGIVRLKGERFGNGLDRPNSQVRRQAGRPGSEGIQAARIFYAPSQPNRHSRDAA